MLDAAAGRAAVIVSLVATVLGAVSLLRGLRTGRDDLLVAGRRYVWLVFLGAVVATAALEHALITHDWRLLYVDQNDSLQTPLIYRITAMWSALQGSILLWALVLSGYLVAVAVRFRSRRTEPIVAWASTIGYLVAAFFFAIMATVSNPFVTTRFPATNGPGPDPLLQDRILVAFHPPMLYLGMIGFTVPFCFAAASLITGRLGEGWMVETRRWTLFAWGCLTGGLVLGGWWSYEVLGWGGYWAWDPVENLAFLPWLTATAYLHSVMVQERRGLLRIWNLSLVIAAFCLTILATFLTRSGVIESVHAFSDSSIGPVLIGFFGVVVFVGVGMIAWRGDRLRAAGGIDGPVSREGAFLANNLLFVAFAFVVLLGTVFPLFYQVFNPTPITVGAPYFNRLVIPIALALLFLMAVAPALPWRKTTLEVMRGRLAVPAAIGVAVVVACVAGGVHGLEPLLAFGLGAFAAASAGRSLVLAVRAAIRTSLAAGHRPTRAALAGWRGLTGRANGGMIVHVGVVLVAVGITAATAFGQRGEVRLSPGQTARFDGHVIEFVRPATVRTPARSALEGVLRVDGTGHFAPAISSFGPNTEDVGTPAIDSGLRDDVYLTIDSVPNHGDRWTFGVVVQPLVVWLWIGGALLAIGSVLSAIPGRRRRRPTAPVSEHVVDVAAPARASRPSRKEKGGSERDAPTDGGDHAVPVGAGTGTGSGADLP